jgi:hypothetical protein
MTQQRSQVEHFLHKEIETEIIDRVWKYVVDSVIDDKFRLLTSVTKEPLPRTSNIEELSSFEIWDEYSSEIVELRNAFRRIGVRADRIREGKVFLRFGNKSFEITEFVRQESKNHYVPLLEREHTPPAHTGRPHLER